jgi:hypothetical protein
MILENKTSYRHDKCFLELDDKAQTISYERYYPYGGTAIIAGKDKTQVQQKRYRYTDKERVYLVD